MQSGDYHRGYADRADLAHTNGQKLYWFLRGYLAVKEMPLLEDIFNEWANAEFSEEQATNPTAFPPFLHSSREVEQDA